MFCNFKKTNCTEVEWSTSSNFWDNHSELSSTFVCDIFIAAMIVVGYKMSNRGSPARSSHSTRGGQTTVMLNWSVHVHCKANKRGVTKIFRVANLYTRITFTLHCDIIRFTVMNIIVVRFPGWGQIPHRTHYLWPFRSHKQRCSTVLSDTR